MENKEYWQDAHIIQREDGFMTYDETGQEHMLAQSLDEARRILQVYSLSLQGECHDCQH